MILYYFHKDPDIIYEIFEEDIHEGISEMLELNMLKKTDLGYIDEKLPENSFYFSKEVCEKVMKSC